MELVKKNVHMDFTKAMAQTQFVLEDDVNLSDVKPDMDCICLEKGKIIIDEVRAYEDAALVRGRLLFSVLYHTDEENRSLAVMEGKIPFEEKVHMQDIDGADTLNAECIIEDLSIGMINSRKISVQSVVNMKVKAWEICDGQVPIGLHDAKGIEYRKESIELAQIAVCKNDVFRIRDEVMLPGNYPNLFQILWSTLSLDDVEIRPHMGKLSMQGELRLVVIYECDEAKVHSFETTIPFSGTVECSGCREDMITDIHYAIMQQELAIRPDNDGEERIIAVDTLLDLNMKLYEELKMDIVADVYGVKEMIHTVETPVICRKLLAKNIGKQKMSQHVRIGKHNSPILQLMHSEGKAVLDGVEIKENAVSVNGVIYLQVLYVSSDENKMYDVVKAQIPYKYEMEIPGIEPEDCVEMQVDLEQLQVVILDGEELDVKAVPVFHTTAFRQRERKMVSGMESTPLDTKMLAGMPGIVIYVVKTGDNLWSIGKRFYVSVERLKKLNNLSGDLIVPGQKLIIVKEGI